MSSENTSLARKPQVLIVGAGPTGLVLALFLAKTGVSVRIIDRHAGPGENSRALGVQARTLEFYRQLGIADEVVARGIPMSAIHLRREGHAVAKIDFAKFGSGLSPYPFVLSFPQDEHEALLVRHLRAAGVEVEWGTELTDLRETPAGVQAILRDPEGIEQDCAVSYVCGCDGARSFVRQKLNLTFAGGTYERTFFVADIEASGAAAAGHSFSLCLGGNGALFVLPVRSTGMHRLIGAVPPEIATDASMRFEDIRDFVEREARIKVRSVHWFSAYQVHHRVAGRFRAGRVFIAGDAAHIHSPVGGQGMNTGIGDAVNLAWKLAAVIRGGAAASLLDTYGTERMGFAHFLVATTDKLFHLMTGRGWSRELFRTLLLPRIAPVALRFSPLRSAVFRLISQTGVNYRNSALSKGQAGGLRAGDRLPWVQLATGGDNFEPLRSFAWQVHVYGETSPELRAFSSQEKVALHEFGWESCMRNAGLKRAALYLVRPDGYLSWVDENQDINGLQAYYRGIGLSSGAGATARESPPLIAHSRR
jgi:2-polyprenyl-6-methoxyphenol hydroxylase-like FAD-dependent oxidoreductase